MKRPSGQEYPTDGDIWFNWNSVEVDDAGSRSAYSGFFFDETLRDGLQAPGVRSLTLPEKYGVIDHMVRCGVRSADLGFPGSDAIAIHNCMEVARYIVANGYPLTQGYAGRTHPSDIHAICDIAQMVGAPVDAYIFIGISPIRQYVENWDIRLIQRNIRDSAAECLRENLNFVLVLEDAIRCTPEVLGQIYQVALDLGVQRVTLCDTVGTASPTGTASIIRWSHRYFDDHNHRVTFDWHGHNDRGLGLINSLTAFALGCERVHGTILGVGERAGNASLDQLIINSHLDGHGSYDLNALRDYCDYAASVLDIKIPRNYPAMGEDVFKTSAGVHASAILKAHEKGNMVVKDAIYSSVPASLLGREQEVLIDASSGESNVRYWLTVHGYRSDDEYVVKEVLAAAKAGCTPLTDEQIMCIVAERILFSGLSK